VALASALGLQLELILHAISWISTPRLEAAE